jgi:hypothetical protein
MPVNLEYIENSQELEAVVAGTGGANRLFVYTGTAVFSLKGTGSNWLCDTLTFEVGRSFTAAQFIKAVATASLASIANTATAVNAGWAVDRVEASRAGASGKIQLKLNLAVRDSDGFLNRASYEAHVLAKL